jgi:hypothetical protein
MASNKNLYPYIARGAQRFITLKSAVINIDNGAGTTIDEVLCASLPSDAIIVSARPVYTEASGAVTAATWSLGIAAAGVTIIAATALEASKAVGDAGADNVGLIPLLKGGSLFMRHTGIAITVLGQYYLQVVLMLKP